eukprot:4687840-Amphidinium_carterae.1
MATDASDLLSNSGSGQLSRLLCIYAMSLMWKSPFSMMASARSEPVLSSYLCVVQQLTCVS